MTRRARLWSNRCGAWLVGLVAWAALPLAAGADNCSSLTDCYGTVASGLAATVGIALVLATVVSLPSILSALERHAANSLGLEPPGDEPAPAARPAAEPTRPPDTDPADAASLARAQPGAGNVLDNPDMPYEGSQASLRSAGAIAPPAAGQVTALPIADSHPAGVGDDVIGGGGLGHGGPAVSSHQDASAAGSRQDLSRATEQPSVPASAEGDRPSIQDDLSRASAGPADMPPLAAGTNLGHGSAGEAAAGAPSAGPPGYPTPHLPVPYVPESEHPDLGGAQSLAAAPPHDAGGRFEQPDHPTWSLDRVGTTAAHQPTASPAEPTGGGLGRHGGAAEPQPVQGAAGLGRGDTTAPGGADTSALSRGGEAHAGGEPFGPGLSTHGPSGAESAQPGVREADLGQGGAGGDQLAAGGRAESSRGLAGATGLGGGPVGGDVGASIARQVLARAESLDHVAQLDLALRGAIGAGIDANGGASVAAGLLHGLGLDAGVAVETSNAILVPSGDGQSMLRYLKATGAFDLLPLDPRVLALTPVGATIGFEPDRGRATFGRYLRWAEGGAASEWLARDPELAAIRAAGLTIIGQTRRVAVARALGEPDQQWATGNLLLAYHLPDWPGYSYIFEFDAAETLRSQGFVAEQRPAAAAALAAGMTRDAVWSQLGAPAASANWWPFERWRYRRADGRSESYEFAHGVLRARFVS